MNRRTKLVWETIFPFVQLGSDRLSIQTTCTDLLSVVDDMLRRELDSLITALPFPLAQGIEYSGVLPIAGKSILKLSFFSGIQRFFVRSPNAGSETSVTADACFHGNRKFIVYEDLASEPFHAIVYEGCYDPIPQENELVINSYKFYMQQTRDSDVLVLGRKDGMKAPDLLKVYCDEGRHDYEGGFPYSRLLCRGKVLKRDGDFSTRGTYTGNVFGFVRFNYRLEEKEMAEKAGCGVLRPHKQQLKRVLRSFDTDVLGKLNAKALPLPDFPIGIRFSHLERGLWKIQIGLRSYGYLTPNLICIVTSILGRHGIEIVFPTEGIRYTCSVARDNDMHYYELTIGKWKEIYDNETLTYRDTESEEVISVIRCAHVYLLRIYNDRHQYLLATPSEENENTEYLQRAQAAKITIASFLTPGHNLQSSSSTREKTDKPAPTKKARTV